MKFIDFFAGVGGFRLGMELAGHECVGSCEFDKFAVMSYTAMHLANKEQLDYITTLPMRERQKEISKEEYRNGEWYANDIRAVKGECLPYADCWCGGFPCQDLSVAGKQVGITDGEMGAILASNYKEPPRVAIPVLTPDRANKRQNGRRFKENGDPSFTLTAQDRHGVAFSVDNNTESKENGIVVELENGVKAYAIWYPKENCYMAIRRLTPKECFRLQGWSDDYFEKAQLVSSDSQLYKQAGNGVTVSVIKEIAERMK